MENFISLFQATKNGNGILNRRLIHHNRLETTLKRLILLNVLSVLVQCCRTDTVEFTSGQHRLQHIAGIHGTVRLAGTNDQMQLIDEKNNLAVALLDLSKNSLQTFLEFTSVLGTGYQCAHIQRINLLVLQAIRHITLDDTLCQTLDNCGLTYTRLTDQYRVVLRLTRKDTDNVTNLRITTNDRIHLLGSCLAYQIFCILTQAVISCLRVITCHTLIASDSGKCLKETISCYFKIPE